MQRDALSSVALLNARAVHSASDGVILMTTEEFGRVVTGTAGQFTPPPDLRRAARREPPLNAAVRTQGSIIYEVFANKPKISNRFARIARVSGCQADDDYNQHGGHHDLITRLSHHFRNEDFVVLDVGTNKGDWTSAILEQRPGAKLFCFGDSTCNCKSTRDEAKLLTAPIEVEKIRCKVETGDNMVKMLQLGRIHMLKIDVEGHEVEGKPSPSTAT
jgi:hypothetical protein